MSELKTGVYTKKEVDIICDRISDNVSFTKIAKELNRSRDSVINRWRLIKRAMGPQATEKELDSSWFEARDNEFDKQWNSKLEP